MIIRKLKDVEEKDIGDILGTHKMGIRMQWLIHSGIGNGSYGHRFALRHFVNEPGSSFPMHQHKYVEAMYVLSGKGFVANEKGKVEIGPGDVVYIPSEEPHGVGAGDESLVLLCTIDCVDGGESCWPHARTVKIVGK